MPSPRGTRGSATTNGIAGLLERRELDARLLRKRDDRAVGGAVREVLEHRDLALVLVQRRVEDDAHVLLVRRFERAREDVGEVVAADHGHRQADVAGAAPGQGARAAVRREVVLAHVPEDDVARLGRHVGAVVDDAGDGGDGHPREPRDVPDRRLSGRALLCWCRHRSSPVVGNSGNGYGSRSPLASRQKTIRVSIQDL